MLSAFKSATRPEFEVEIKAETVALIILTHELVDRRIFGDRCIATWRPFYSVSRRDRWVFRRSAANPRIFRYRYIAPWRVFGSFGRRDRFFFWWSAANRDQE